MSIPSNPSCGVALCTCNGAKFLSAQLESLIAQTVIPKEIVVCDDRSDDNSWDILKSWAANVAEPLGIEVTLVQNTERMGVTRNFELACSKLCTDLILLCDQDDIWLENKIERLLSEFRDPGVMLVHSNAHLVGGELDDLGINLFQALRFSKRERRLIREGRFLEIYCCRNLVTGAATAFRRSLLSVACPFPPEWVHDEWLAAMAASCGRIVMLPECLLMYRQHGNNAIGVPKNAREYVSHGLRRIREAPRSEFFPKRLRRLAIWLARIESLDGDHAKNREHIKGALEHFRSRSKMTANPFYRFRIIWAELQSGGYDRYSHMRSGLLRDLFYI